MKNLIALIICSTILSGCGGGGNGGTSTTPPIIDSGTCSIADQNQQLLSLLQDKYYWYQDLSSSLNSASYSSPYDLLDAARVPQDRFSFILTEAQYTAAFTDANFVGYGFSHQVSVDLTTLEIRYVYNNGAAHDAGMARGDKITAVDGMGIPQLIALVAAGNTTWSAVFGASTEGVSATINWQKPSGEIFSENLVKTVVDTNTVLKSQVFSSFDKQVGYVVFNSFVERSRADLNAAFDQFKQANVSELVLDLRYNGGELVSVANQLSTQIGGINVENQTFVNLVHNNKHPENNSTQLFALGEGVEQLDLDRVVVLTTGASCSASELVINALKPFVDVVTVGERTCGKPVGMNPVQICDKVIFAINFETTNALGVGGYFDGLPTQCFAQDKIVADWGSLNDPLLREGMYYIDNGQCFSANKTPFKQRVNPVDFSQGPIKARNDQ
jgi:carboxyl-terminal processing protease